MFLDSRGFTLNPTVERNFNRCRGILLDMGFLESSGEFVYELRKDLGGFSAYATFDLSDVRSVPFSGVPKFCFGREPHIEPWMRFRLIRDFMYNLPFLARAYTYGDEFYYFFKQLLVEEDRRVYRSLRRFPDGYCENCMKDISAFKYFCEDCLHLYYNWWRPTSGHREPFYSHILPGDYKVIFNRYLDTNKLEISHSDLLHIVNSVYLHDYPGGWMWFCKACSGTIALITDFDYWGSGKLCFYDTMYTSTCKCGLCNELLCQGIGRDAFLGIMRDAGKY